jgi:hypothetical protein
MGEEILKSQVFLSDINGSKRVARTWNMMKEVVVTRSHRADENVEKVRSLVHSERGLGIRATAVQLN